MRDAISHATVTPRLMRNLKLNLFHAIRMCSLVYLSQNKSKITFVNVFGYTFIQLGKLHVCSVPTLYPNPGEVIYESYFHYLLIATICTNQSNSWERPIRHENPLTCSICSMVIAQIEMCRHTFVCEDQKQPFAPLVWGRNLDQ